MLSLRTKSGQQYQTTGMSNRTSLLLKPPGRHSKKYGFVAIPDLPRSTKCAPKVAPKKQRWVVPPKNVSPWGGDCSLGFGLVTLHVQGQMVGAGEASIADLAFEGFGSGMLSYMTSEFVGPCKTPLTALEMTFVWFLTCNRNIQDKSRFVYFYRCCLYLYLTLLKEKH
jgi:hypothetical protein